MPRQAEMIRHPGELGRRRPVEVLGLDEQERAGRKVVEPAIDLFRVEPAFDIPERALPVALALDRFRSRGGASGSGAGIRSTAPKSSPMSDFVRWNASERWRVVPAISIFISARTTSWFAAIKRYRAITATRTSPCAK
jgi:hypothetical protein